MDMVASEAFDVYEKSIPEMRSNVIFCALARDCRRRLKHNTPAFRKLHIEFPEAKWLFIENDSRDGTRTWLENWARRDSRIIILGSDTGECTIPDFNNGSQVVPGYSLHRIQRMALFRNLYLEWIGKYYAESEDGVVVVIDPDVRSIPVSRIVHWVNNLQPHQAITALGLRWCSPLRMEFHDAYAYRDREDHSIQTWTGILARRRTLAEKFCGGDVLPVRSNFNGLGIYPLAAMRGCRYYAPGNADPQVEADCEHVSLHDQLRSKGIEVMIDPRLKVVYNGWLAVTTGTHRAKIKKFITGLFGSK